MTEQVGTPEGFVYVPTAEPGPFPADAVGRRVSTGSWSPPYLVVSHSVARVLVHRWPGRLYRVRVPAPTSQEERNARADAQRGVRPDAGYSRVFAVDVVEALDPAVLFGPHGAAVVGVLDIAAELDQPAAERLASARHPLAGAVYARAWDAWLARRPQDRRYVGGNESTLAAGAGPVRSPVGDAFTLAHGVVLESAGRRATGTFAVADDDEDGGSSDVHLVGPWARAAAALCEAVMAVGSPHLMDDADRAVLLAAVRAIR